MNSLQSIFRLLHCRDSTSVFLLVRGTYPLETGQPLKNFYHHRGIKTNSKKPPPYKCKTKASDLVSQILNHRLPPEPRKRHDANRIKNSFHGMTRQDPMCDDRLQSLIADKQHGELVPQLALFVDLERFPSKTTLRVLASIFAKQGDEAGIRLVQKVASEVYPIESAWMAQYRHYLAEALWKNDRREEASRLLVDLFRDVPKLRRKVTNLSSLMMKDVFLRQLRTEYKYALEIALSCLQVGECTPAANLWRWSFSSSDVQARNMGEDLLQKHPAMRHAISKKINNIVRIAYETSEVDVLQRLMQVMLANELTAAYRLVFGALISVQCDLQDLRGATETFHYCTNLEIKLPPSSIRRLVALHNYHHVKIPDDLLNTKYSYEKSKLPELQW